MLHEADILAFLTELKGKFNTSNFEAAPAPKNLKIFRINRSIFLTIHQGTQPLIIDLKCDPKLSKLLRQRYETIQPSKTLGNQGIELILTNQLPAQDIKDLITHSFHRAATQPTSPQTS